MTSPDARALRLFGQSQPAAPQLPPATFWYLASPYSRFGGGIHQAYRFAVEATGLLILARVPVFSPIVHTHTVAGVCGIDPADHDVWLPADRPLMDAASGIIVLRLAGWDESFGVDQERKVFRAAGKPEVFMDPGRVPAEVQA